MQAVQHHLSRREGRSEAQGAKGRQQGQEQALRSSSSQSSSSQSSSGQGDPRDKLAALHHRRQPGSRRGRAYAPWACVCAVGVRMPRLQRSLRQAGQGDTRPDRLLAYEEAAGLLGEYKLDIVPLSTSSDAFDVYPAPPLRWEDRAKAPPRQHVVALLGHAGHGKTTLLRMLRGAASAGETGITQHIEASSAASSVAASGALTLLDTPGHAAFAAMRARAAAAADIVVVVVAADEGVMAQTEEALALVHEDKAAGAQLIVVLTKTDAPQANTLRVTEQLTARIGHIACVHVSSQPATGLSQLREALSVAQRGDRRAESSGVPLEGSVLESRVEKGLGITATVLVKRGSLAPGDVVVAGLAWAKVRVLLDEAGKTIKGTVGPGAAATVTGWKALPKAGDEVLGVQDAGGSGAEALARKAIQTREGVEERRKLQLDSESINEGRRIKHEEDELKSKLAYEARKLRRERAKLYAMGKIPHLPEMPLSVAVEAAEETHEEQPVEIKELRLIVKADASGTAEAIVGAISALGNAEVQVKIISEGVGEPNEGDLTMAKTFDGQIIGFNVKAPRAMLAAASPIKIQCDGNIDRLIAYVSDECAALIPPEAEASEAVE